MYSYVPMDEKRFRIIKDNQSFYLVPGDVRPYPTSKSKSFIEKVTFLRAVARSRYNSKTKSNFDGKIGIWPFVHNEATQRSSRDRPVGTLEMKAIKIRSEIYKFFSLEKVFFAICSKCSAQQMYSL